MTKTVVLLFFFFFYSFCSYADNGYSYGTRIKGNQKEFYKFLKERYKASDAYYIFGDDNTKYILLSVKNDYVVLDQTGMHTIVPACYEFTYKPAIKEGYDKYGDWYKSAEAVFITDNGRICTNKGVYKNTIGSNWTFFNGQFLSFDGTGIVYTQDGSLLTTRTATSWGADKDWLFYKDMIGGVNLEGAKNLRTGKIIPNNYISVKNDNGAIYVRKHIYSNWEEYESVQEVDKTEYSELEKLLSKEQYADAVVLFNEDSNNTNQDFKMLGLYAMSKFIRQQILIGWNFAVNVDFNKNYQDYVDVQEIRDLDYETLHQAYKNTYAGYAALTEKFPQVEHFKEMYDVIKCDMDEWDERTNSYYIQIDKLDNYIAQVKQQREEDELRAAAAVMNILGNTIQNISNATSRSSSSTRTRNYNNHSSSASGGYTSSGGISDSNNSSSSQTQEKQKVMKKHNPCNGTGKLPNVSIHDADGPKSYCSTCGCDVPKHTHKTCSPCNGTGEIFDKWK